MGVALFALYEDHLVLDSFELDNGVELLQDFGVVFQDNNRNILVLELIDKGL